MPNTFELLTRASINNMSQPFRFARFVRRTVATTLRNIGALRSAIPAAPRTRFSSVVTAHRVVDGRAFDLAQVKEIKSSVPGATVNDAVVAVVTGALRRYLMDKDELPDAPLVAMAPISVRTDR